MNLSVNPKLNTAGVLRSIDTWEGELPDLPPELGGVEVDGLEERRGDGAGGQWGGGDGLVHSTCDAANYLADLVERLGTHSLTHCLSLSHTHMHTHTHTHTHMRLYMYIHAT
jgi:hypothetical protein